MILSLSFFQHFAHYRNFFTSDHPQTYPLPPRSTVLGMLQNVTSDYYGHRHPEKWKGLEIAIFGNFTTKFRNYTILRKLNNGTNFEGYIYKNHFMVGSNERYLENSPTLIEELFNVNLVFFLKGDKELLNEIYKNIGKKVVFLGKAEDVLFLNEKRFLSDDEIKENKGKLIFWNKDYGSWFVKEDVSLNSKIWQVPVHINYFSGNGIAKNRAEILYNREKGKRESVIKFLYYIPPYNEVKINKEIKYTEIFIKEGYLKDYEFKIPIYSWLKG